MPDLPSTLRALRLKWGSLPGVTSIEIRHVGVRTVVLIDGVGALPPRGITSTITIDVGGTRPPAVLPVYWRQVPASKPRAVSPGPGRGMRSANDAMWAGASPVVNRPVDIIEVGGRRLQEPMSGNIPEPKRTEFQLALPARSMGEPAFWSQGFDNGIQACVSQLNLVVNSLVMELDDTEEAIIQSISYGVTGIPVGYQILVRVTANGGQVLAEWHDIAVTTGGNPASQFALAGSVRPMPLVFTVRHGKEVSISITVLGAYPFTSPYTPLTSAATIIINGWRQKVNDTRDGAPRPSNLGDMNNAAFGMEELLTGPIDPELVDAVSQYLNAEV